MRLIYNSRLGMYFLNLLLFTQPSTVNVTAAICEHLVFINGYSEQTLNYYFIRIDNFLAGEF